eukprot:TRINITY_DN2044_c0_g1_i1.p1 TRINITY_DN2044_c0_g1~~TRINITY_DN2044_c0_g1_i1.p1  ORF type:complete len:1453 (-),score=173.00 TRINITY_DN2044_c0_g1_i1:1104-5462(-)
MLIQTKQQLQQQLTIMSNIQPQQIYIQFNTLEQNMDADSEGSEKAQADVAPAHILSEEDLKDKLKVPKSETQSTLAETIKFLTFGIVLIIIIFLIFGDPTHAGVGAAIRKELLGYDRPYNTINTQEKYMEWVREFITYNYQTEYYEGRKRPRDRDPETNYANYFVSMIRLVQRRMRLEKGNKDFENYRPLVWTSSGFNPQSSGDDNEDTKPFGPNKEYTYSKQFRLPGYTTWFNTFRDNMTTSLNKLTQLEEQEWTNNQTRSITVDFVLFNSYVQVFTYANLVLVFSQTGTVKSKLTTRHIDKTYYEWHGIKLFRACCEVIFVLLLGIYVLLQPYSIYATYKRVNSEHEDQEIVKARTESKKANSNKGKCRGWIEVVVVKIKLCFLVLYEHFTSMWNLLDLCCISLSFTACIYWILFISHQQSYLITAESFQDPLTNDLLLHACDLFYTCRSICAFDLIFILIRLLKCLGFFSPRVAVLFGALNKAKYDIIYFLIFIVAVMFGFILFTFLYFGPTLESYSSPDRVITALFEFMNWWYGSFDELLQVDLIVGTILFIIFMIIVVFVLLNMFVGFLHKGYKEANEELKNESTGRDETGKKVVFFIEIHWWYQILEFVYQLMGVVRRKFKDEAKKMRDERREYTEILKQTKNESDDFDREYNPMQSFAQEKNKIPLTSHYMELRANIERDKRCGRIFYSTIVFFIFILLYILLLFQQLAPGYGSSAVSSSHEQVVNNIKLKFDEEGENLYNFNDVVDLEYLTGWIRDGPAKYVEETGNQYESFAYILGDEFRVTLRQGKILGGKTQIDPAFARITKEKDITKKDLPNERKEPIVGRTGTVYNYSQTGGYLGNGGYVFYWAANQSEIATQANRLVDDAIIGPDTWLFSLEYVTYEPASGIHLYNALLFIILDTGNIVHKLFSSPLHFPDFSTVFGVRILLLEIIFILFLGYYMVLYVLGFINAWKDYSNWIESETPFFSPLERYQREQKCPELLRQLKHVFSLYRILDLLFFAFSIVSITYWGIFIYKSRKLIRVFPYDHNTIDYHTKMRLICNVQNAYIDYSALALMVSTIRMIEYLQYSGNMRVLTTTLIKAFEDLMYFLIIFVTLMLGFAGMANIAFSQISPSFQTLGDSWASCFIMLMGEFDISPVLNEERAMGSLFIFIFLILFSYILLNIFLAILEINFTLAKEEISKVDDRIRKLNALFCCLIQIPGESFKVENQMEQSTDLPTALAVLNDMTIQLEAVHQSLRWWADGVANQINLEMKQQRAYKGQVCKQILKVTKKNLRDERKHNMINAAKERKGYLHYLRVTTQFLEYQCTAIEAKKKAIEEELKAKHGNYLRDKREYFNVKKILDKLDEEMKKRKDEALKKLEEQERNEVLNEQLKKKDEEEPDKDSMDSDISHQQQNINLINCGCAFDNSYRDSNGNNNGDIVRQQQYQQQSILQDKCAGLQVD